MSARIFIDQPALKRNRETGGNEPIIVVERAGVRHLCKEAALVDLKGRVVGRVVYDPDARPSAWIEYSYGVEER